MKVNVATINKGLDGNYYAHWYDSKGKACVESDPDCVYLESKIINERGVTDLIFCSNYWNS